MKQFILKKIIKNLTDKSVLRAELVYLAMRTASYGQMLAMSREMQLSYDDENYIMFFDGRTEYPYSYMESRLEAILQQRAISEKDIRECNYIANNIRLGMGMSNKEVNLFSQMYDYILEALQLTQDGEFSDARCFMRGAKRMVTAIIQDRRIAKIGKKAREKSNKRRNK